MSRPECLQGAPRGVIDGRLSIGRQRPHHGLSLLARVDHAQRQQASLILGMELWGCCCGDQSGRAFLLDFPWLYPRLCLLNELVNNATFAKQCADQIAQHVAIHASRLVNDEGSVFEIFLRIDEGFFG